MCEDWHHILECMCIPYEVSFTSWVISFLYVFQRNVSLDDEKYLMVSCSAVRIQKKTINQHKPTYYHQRDKTRTRKSNAERPQPPTIRFDEDGKADNMQCRKTACYVIK